MKPLLHSKTSQALESVLAVPPQTLLLVAKPGAGKQTLATYIAAELLGTDPITLPNHPYFLLYGDTDGTISIDTVRDAQHFLSRKVTTKTPINRVVVIANADRLTPEAQNAFLKTLEEPPVGSVLILTVSDKQRLLPTIVSRLAVLDVTTPDEASVRAHFAAAGHNPQNIDRAFLMSGGLPGLMNALLSGEQNHPLVQAAETARNLLRLDTFGRLALSDTLAKQRQQCLDVCFILQQMAELSLRSSGKATNVYRQWQTVLRQSYEAERALLTQAQPKLVLTDLMLSL